jgi:hypothetical protein
MWIYGNPTMRLGIIHIYNHHQKVLKMFGDDIPNSLGIKNHISI